MKHRSDAGFSLAALIFFVTAASILAAAAVPAYQMQAKRDLEEELIFRGEEYARAIQKYQRRFGVYPTSIEQLVETNGIRFVRRAYKDPITDKEFRLIFINPDGSVTGSTLFNRSVGNQPLFGNTQTLNQNQQTGFAQQQQFQQQAQQFQQQGQRPGQQGQQLGQQQQGQRLGQQGSQFPTAGGLSNQPVSSGGLIGVASDSDKDSLKVYNQRQKYNEWEFIAILGQPGQQQQPGQQPGQQNPQQNQQPGIPNNPFQNQPQSPFGAPQGNPLGGTPGQPIQQPFGFGNPPQPTNQPVKRP